MSLHKFKGKVIHGNKRGKELGFPTANILLSSPIPEGIYISIVELRNLKYKALTFIGASKTFGDTEVISETFILDFDQDIYGIELEVDLLKMIRGNEKFKGAVELIERMNKDKLEAEEYFLKNELV